MRAVVYLDKTDLAAAIKAYVEATGLKVTESIKMADHGDIELRDPVGIVTVEIQKPLPSAVPS